jgi:hypothetical protein
MIESEGKRKKSERKIEEKELNKRYRLTENESWPEEEETMSHTHTERLPVISAAPHVALLRGLQQ